MSGPAPPVRRRLVVRGRVQNVGFRWSCARVAEALVVAGWVRNRADGSVEVLAEGPAAAVETLVEWCRAGPDGAVVRDVTVVDEAPRGESGFRVVR